MKDQKTKMDKEPKAAAKEIIGIILSFKPGDQNNILDEVRKSVIDVRKKQIDDLHKDAEILKDLLGGL